MWQKGQTFKKEWSFQYPFALFCVSKQSSSDLVMPGVSLRNKLAVPTGCSGWKLDLCSVCKC